MDRLQNLLQRFSVSARMFHSGPLCGIHDFDGGNGCGQLHLVRRGPVQARHAGAPDALVEQPSLLLYPRPLAHRFITDARTGAELACADVVLGGGGNSPIAQALPAVVVLPLAELPVAATVLELLFDEAFSANCGRRYVVDRLFEVVLVMILRRLLDGDRLQTGALAGLAHPQLAKALVAIHETPGEPWTLVQLAQRSGMSRSRFAEVFADIVGVPAATYLARYRIALAQDLLRRERPLAVIADEVGYGSAAALSRAFSAHCGCSPRAWLREQAQN